MNHRHAGFDRRMRAIPEAVRAEVKAEMERTADEICEDMRKFARRGRTGEMALSIGWTWGEAPEGTIAVYSIGTRSYGSMRITIYAGGKGAFYAVFQEHGTKKMRAHPFFFPVWRAWRRKAKTRISRAVTRALKKF